MSWSDKRILITGGSSGIGFRVIEKALAQGATVSVLTRRLTEQLAKLDCERLHVYQGSVSDRAQVQAWVKEALAKFGEFNTVLNNAGAMYYMDIMSADYDEMKTMVETNCLGLVNLIDAVLPVLKNSLNPHWLNITSDAGRQAFPGLAIYSGTKAFVEFSAKAMRQELIKYNIKITNIQPGNVATPLHTKSTDKQALSDYATENAGQYLAVEDIVHAITYAISTPHHIAVNEILIEPLTESI